MKNILVLFWLCTATHLPGQPLSPDIDFPVSYSNLIYHPATRSVILAGGSFMIPDSTVSNVWSWNGKSWKLTNAAGPGSRDFFRSAVHSKTGISYFYGGMIEDGTPQNDMWTLENMKWKKVAQNALGTHDHHNMVYMDHLDAFMIYGGNFNRYPNFDSITWIYKDGHFKKLNIPGPGYRWHNGMVYDKYRKKVMLYGGGEKPDEQWEFDGIKWTKIQTIINPGKRYYHQMIYHEDLKCIILHGGWINQNPRDTSNASARTTWLWNGNNWKKMASEPIFASAMVYDPDRKKVIAYGQTGLNESSPWAIWDLKNNKWTKIKEFGSVDKSGYLKNYLIKNPEDTRALTKYADHLVWQENNFRDAEVIYKKLVSLYPSQPNYWIELTYALSAQNKMDDAAIYLQKIKNAGLANIPFYSRFAGMLHREKRYPSAIFYYEPLLQIDPSAINYYNAGCAYSLTGNTEKAFEYLNKAIDKGYNVKANYEADVELAPLKSDIRWSQMLIKLK